MGTWPVVGFARGSLRRCLCLSASSCSRSSASGAKNASESKDGRSSRFFGSHTKGAWLILFIDLHHRGLDFVLVPRRTGQHWATCPFESGAFVSDWVATLLDAAGLSESQRSSRLRRSVILLCRFSCSPQLLDDHRAELQAPAHLALAPVNVLHLASSEWHSARCSRSTTRHRARSTSKIRRRRRDHSARARSSLTSPGRTTSTSWRALSAVAASRSARPGTPRSRCHPSCSSWIFATIMFAQAPYLKAAKGNSTYLGLGEVNEEVLAKLPESVQTEVMRAVHRFTPRVVSMRHDDGYTLRRLTAHRLRPRDHLRRCSVVMHDVRCLRQSVPRRHRAHRSHR